MYISQFQRACFFVSSLLERCLLRGNATEERIKKNCTLTLIDIVQAAIFLKRYN
jgi:hypothetical protein